VSHITGNRSQTTSHGSERAARLTELLLSLRLQGLQLALQAGPGLLGLLRGRVVALLGSLRRLLGTRHHPFQLHDLVVPRLKHRGGGLLRGGRPCLLLTSRARNT
jgi:hypothetical protein